jgi:cellulose synthase/poly-beta-1,6-N-acetylglucosamine synthase-like glycosyltransferase
MMQINWNLIQSILWYALIGVGGVQLFYYLVLFSRFVFFSSKRKESPNSAPPVSVIICAKNELDNLQKNLSIVLEQQYPTFEVIVANDNSEDGTDDFLANLKMQYPHLKVVHIRQESRTFKGKRLALSLALKAASYEWCVFTDADCAPTSPSWLFTMQRNFQSNKGLVLGYAPHYKAGGFLNKCIRFETFWTAFQYLNFAMSGVPYMGVGRNMAYRKQLFFDNKGYIQQPNVISGDDDLFVNKIAKGSITSVEIDSKTFMYSNPKRTWNDWMWQKRRHLSTGKLYRGIHKFLLGAQSLTHTLFYVLLIALLVTGFHWQWVLIAYGVRFVVQLIDFSVAMYKLKELDLLWLFPLFDLLLIVYNIVMLPAVIKKPSNKWK